MKNYNAWNISSFYQAVRITENVNTDFFKALLYIHIPLGVQGNFKSICFAYVLAGVTKYD